jgi:hypothetical protein
MNAKGQRNLQEGALSYDGPFFLIASGLAGQDETRLGRLLQG